MSTLRMNMVLSPTGTYTCPLKPNMDLLRG